MKRASIAVSVFALALSFATAAHADDPKKQCADSYEKAQYLQRDGKLTAARAQLLVCAADACPGFVRSECAKWLTEVDANQPTVIFAVHDADGHDLVDVRVEVDGALLTEKVGGSALPVDPGEHTFRLTRSASSAAVEQKVVIRVTEKNRIVRFDFPREATGTGTGTETGAGTGTRAGSSGGFIPGIVVGAAGLAMLGVSIGLGVSAQSDADALRNSACAPRCPSSDLDAVKTKLIVGDVFLGVGIAALGVATVLFFVRPGKGTPQATLSVVPTAFGANATVRFSF